MKKSGIVSYNIYANFTNYGSALQSWALYTAIKKYGKSIEPILVNYCPDILLDKDPLKPIKNMWDTDDESRKMCELSMPAIRVNYEKFMNFYNTKFTQTHNKYLSSNFNTITNEDIDAFVCGSDTIFCIEEFGFDDGYYANYDIMKNNYTFSYAASFGDSTFDKSGELTKLFEKLNNFKALGLREDKFIDKIKNTIKISVQRVCNPTLLLTKEDYLPIKENKKYNDRYILLYARRYNKKMEEFADKLAKEKNLKVIEISLRAINSNKHIMNYEAGVEKFLSLVENAEYIVTNSYHGIIFSILFEKDFFGFSREQCDNKIYELLLKFGITDRLLINGNEKYKSLNYENINDKISEFRKSSIEYLTNQLNEASEWKAI